MKRAPTLTKRQRKALAPERPPRVPCGSININFEPTLQCEKEARHWPPRHAAKAPKGTMYGVTDVGGKKWYWAEYMGEYDGAVWRPKGEMLAPLEPPSLPTENEDEQKREDER